jgi:hypothetical protein
MGTIKVGDEEQEHNIIDEVDSLIREQIVFDYIFAWDEFLQEFIRIGKREDCLRAALQFNTDFARGCKIRYGQLSLEQIIALMAEGREVIKAADEQQQYPSTTPATTIL